MLAWTIYISFLGVLLLLLPKVNVPASRLIALVTATVAVVAPIAARVARL